MLARYPTDFAEIPEAQNRSLFSERGSIGVAHDYEKKYEPDPPFQGAGPQARIWQVYGKEADELDSDMIGGWKATIDVFLVFV
ncbi:uncharacterized protein C8Q71DRAFT_862644 [Rhodofomes roseus]|uniref:DUF6535 domain-containing protein n=1 Tax=Rhodofomes roseus TaxID=34475 RepID=A0ABQ8K2B4_9APHY|nr:uncharacterized protein C8Q71DRAFT_862644 [Rhodofomes roseus]KAH9830355.1 hypothetical protein C8Q71DRAFT_862644 [Rhodofomes roseus]